MVCTFSPDSGVRSTVDELVDLGWQVNIHQHRIVHLAARYDDEQQWFHQGFKSAGAALAKRLEMQSSTTREWVRVGHMLGELPMIDAAFAANEISYAKVRVLTRWAEPDNEEELLALAETRSADRLRTAIARALAVDDDDESRDARQHEARSFTSYTDGDGMVVIRVVLPPLIAKVILAAIEELVRLIAKTPFEDHDTAHADTGVWAATQRESGASDDASGQPSVVESSESTTSGGERSPGSSDGFVAPTPPLAATLREMRARWQPGADDDWEFPTLAQQRADAFAAFFLRLDIKLTTEVIIHVRGDGNTFDDGTPLTNNAVASQLDDSFIRLLIHDAERRPVNASCRRRHPTPGQKRVVGEAHNHECVDCESTDLLEFDHNPPYEQTRHTITDELEPRCAPCHRARHRSTTGQPTHR